MKTFTLLFFMTLISFVNIYAYEFIQIEQKGSPIRCISKTVNDSTEKPIRLTLSIGTSWKYPKAAEHLMDKVDAQIIKYGIKKAHYQESLNAKNSRLTDRQKGLLAYKIKDINSRIAELMTSKADIERLGNDKQHIYEFFGEAKDCGAHYIMKGKEKNITIQGSSDAQIIHEIRHISLSLQDKRGLRFSKNNLLLPVFVDGSVDELQGYRAQFAFQSNSLPDFYPKYLEDVNLEYIGNIQKTDGSFAYPGILKIVEDDKSIAKSNKKTDKNSMRLPNTLANVKQKK